MTTNIDPKPTPPSPPIPPTAKPDIPQYGGFPIPRQLEDLYELDAELAELPANASAERRAALLSRRSKARLEFGFSELAVHDMADAHMLRAQAPQAPGSASPAPSYVDDARLAEALRVDARDRLLSKTSAPALFDAVERSVGLFRLALQKLAASSLAPPQHHAWVHAHLAAAQTMNYWITISENPREAKNGLGVSAFEEAEAHFEHAIELDDEYAWAHRFLAHLHALRGDRGDFEFAIQCLRQADAIEQKVAEKARQAKEAAKNEGRPSAAASSAAAPAGEAQQSSFQRSLAMLFSYVAVQSDNAEAAHQSIAAGLQALARDPDELHAPHSIAASLFWLAHYGPEADRAKHAAYLQPAIEGAYLHARNAASRASGVLASLALMEGLQKQRDVGEAAAKARRILEGFAQMGIPADLETRAFSYRTPSVALLEKQLLAAGDSRDEHTSSLRSTFKPMMESLTTQLAIPNPNRPTAATGASDRT